MCDTDIKTIQDQDYLKYANLYIFFNFGNKTIYAYRYTLCLDPSG